MTTAAKPPKPAQAKVKIGLKNWDLVAQAEAASKSEGPLDALAALALGDANVTPLQFLTAVYQDARVPLDLRLDAAKAAAPYVHQRLAALEVSGPQKGAVVIQLSSMEETL